MTKLNFKKSLLIYIIIILFTGCGSTLNLTDYTPSPMEKAKNMPSIKKMMSKSSPKVIIMDIDNNGIKVAQQAKVGSAIATKINTLLASAKNVKIAKRITKSSYEKMLSKEIEAAQLSKELGIDVGQADNIIIGQLSTASYDHSFTEGYYYVIKTKEGNIRKYQPPMMRYEACIIGNLKVFTLPGLEEEVSFEYDECSSTSTEVRSARNVVSRNDGLVRQAALESADTVSYDLKNFFSKKGYIYESKRNGNDIIIKTTLGSSNGAKEGEEVMIYTIEDSINILTSITSKEIVQIGTGTISNHITPSSSWIIIDDLQNGKTVHAGDYIKIQYEESFFSKAKKFLK